MSDSATIQSFRGQTANVRGSLLKLKSSYTRLPSYQKRLIILVVFVGIIGFSFLFAATLKAGANGIAITQLPKNPDQPAPANQTPSQQPPVSSENNISAASSNSTLNINVESSTSSSPQKQKDQATTTLTVNGQSTSVTNGSVRKVIRSSDGSTKLNISVKNNSSSGGDKE